MRVLKNILIALGFLFAAAAIGLVLNSLEGTTGWPKSMHGFLLLGTAIWAAVSSNRLEFRKYKSAMAYHPMTIFLVHLLLWVVVFPWFLTIRDNIKDGTTELKDEFKPEPASTTYSQSSAFRTPPGPPVFGSLDAPQQIPAPPVRSSVPPPLPPPMPQQSKAVPPPLPSVMPKQSVPVPPPLPAIVPVPPPLPDPPPLPRPQAASITDRFEQLQKLAQLKEQGILTESEFQGEKQKILSQA